MSRSNTPTIHKNDKPTIKNSGRRLQTESCSPIEQADEADMCSYTSGECKHGEKCTQGKNTYVRQTPQSYGGSSVSACTPSAMPALINSRC